MFESIIFEFSLRIGCGTWKGVRRVHLVCRLTVHCRRRHEVMMFFSTVRGHVRVETSRVGGGDELQCFGVDFCACDGCGDEVR